MVRFFAAAAFAAFFMSALLSSSPVRAAEAAVIGTIMEVEGDATILRDGQKAPVKAAVKDSLHLNDVVETGPGARAFVLFIDDTQMTLSEKTKLKVDKYVFDPDDASANAASFNILQGTFQYLSGLIAKQRKTPEVTIDTPYGTIGIRGTKLWGGQVENAYGIHVDEGQIQVKNEGGAVIVDKGKGTSLRSRKEAPPAAMPWPAQQLQFIAATILLKNQAAVLERIIGFQGQQKLLRGQFKNFLKLKRCMPGNNLKDLVPGGDDLPIDGGKRQRRDRKGDLPLKMPGGLGGL
jgi:hypothetical protein